MLILNYDDSAVWQLRTVLSERKHSLAYVRSFGCLLNVSDGEKIKGLLRSVGYDFTEDETKADLIILNTCAVRESAEDRVFGIIGSMKKLKQENPGLIIGICGCMTEQEQVVEKIKKSYPQVDFVMGTSSLRKLPELILGCYRDAGNFSGKDEYDDFCEDIEQIRESAFKASVPIMYGCNNFCTYCIVPYVRGRERSRRPDDIIDEVTGLVGRGYKEIMLLGQNVNSYGKDLGDDTDFPGLLRRLNDIPGDFLIRFMSSHPKDASSELLNVIFECEKVGKHLHLPVQSGSDRILSMMNRGYTIKKYLEIIDCMRNKDPSFSFSTDLIVGFPDERDDDFEATLDLMKYVKYDNIYSFIYSKRSGTRAAAMYDPVSDNVKSGRMRRLLDTQREISTENYRRFRGRRMRVLVEGRSKKRSGLLTGKSNECIIAEFEGDSSLIGKFVTIEVTETKSWAVKGKIIN